MGFGKTARNYIFLVRVLCCARRVDCQQIRVRYYNRFDLFVPRIWKVDLHSCLWRETPSPISIHKLISATPSNYLAYLVFHDGLDDLPAVLLTAQKRLCEFERLLHGDVTGQRWFVWINYGLNHD